MGGRQYRAGADHGQPEEYAEPAEQRPHPGQGPLQETIRIEQRKAQCQRRPQPASPKHAFMLLMTPENLHGVGWYIAQQRIGGMQLAEQADRLFLRRGAVTQMGAGRVPDLLHRSLAVHQADEVVRCRRKTVRALGSVILENKPHLVAERLAQNSGVGADSRLE